jgi:hypothetical protein
LEIGGEAEMKLVTVLVLYMCVLST